MATTVRKELSVAANNLHSLNLIYLINATTFKSTALPGKAFSAANQQMNAAKEIETGSCVLSAPDNS